ncbi:death ligand signal enhancer isoform X3 [Cavia porcellus]|uniref:death ligand signal enhancer isoform X3 n=1 Tax=Cavia porcellus TaxID=10141 RepID=UPI002FE0A903
MVGGVRAEVGGDWAGYLGLKSGAPGIGRRSREVTKCGRSSRQALPRLLSPDFRGVTPKPTSPDGPQATSSSLLVSVPNVDRSGPHGPSTSRNPKFHRWKNAFQWMSARVSPHTLWDAVSWGTLAVLALQVARQLHFQALLSRRPRQAEHRSWRSPLDRFLSSPWWHPPSSLRRHVLPGPDGLAPRHVGFREPRLDPEEPGNFSVSSSRAADPQEPLEEGFPFADLTNFKFLNASGSFESKPTPAQPQHPGEKKEQDKSKTLSLEEAVASLQQLFQLSVSIAFNFLGTENMRNRDYVAAFAYFQKAADRGYSKAQYNVGLCHEHGRGTHRDLHKDSQSRYHLGICYEKGLGVQRNLGEAVRCYQQSAALGNEPAQQRLRTLLSTGAAALRPSHLTVTGLKSFSSPSLCRLNSLLAGASDLPHAWSTGNLNCPCRSPHLGGSRGTRSSAVPNLERSLVRLGFG